MAMQQTLAGRVEFAGFGLHSGTAAVMVLHPAPANTGIVFRRSDVAGSAPIAALYNAVIPSHLCTLIGNAAGQTVSTTEHIMAALAGCAIHNAVIDIDGPEVPILDGSSAPFVAQILRAGIVTLDAHLQAIVLRKTIEVRSGAAFARLEPADMLEIAFEIDFDDAAIGRQAMVLNMANGAFVRELSDCRTFCRNSDVIDMRARGLALGGTLENAVVFDGDRVLSPGGLRRVNEPVRHKMLDALGDLALAGAPLLARYTGHRAGHAMTNALLRALFADQDAYVMQDVSQPMFGKMPGIGVHAGDLPLLSRAS